MTGRTAFRGDVWSVGDLQRHMGLVAVVAFLCRHLVTVRLMAVKAVGNFSMGVMAGRAMNRGVITGIGFQFSPLLLMTGQTGICNLPA